MIRKCIYKKIYKNIIFVLQNVEYISTTNMQYKKHIYIESNQIVINVLYKQLAPPY